MKKRILLIIIPFVIVCSFRFIDVFKYVEKILTKAGIMVQTDRQKDRQKDRQTDIPASSDPMPKPPIPLPIK